MSGSQQAAPPSRRSLALRLGVVALAVLFLALLGYGLVVKSPDRDIDEALAAGEALPAPGFELPLLERGDPGPRLAARVEDAGADGAVTLEEFRGTPVVLNFWASWCEPCRDEARVLEDGWRASRQRGTLFLGLNMQDLTGDARAFMEELGASYPSVRDESNRVAIDWGVTGLPETFFVDADGDVVAHAIGAVSDEQLAAGVAAAEQGRPLGSISGGDRRSVR